MISYSAMKARPGRPTGQRRPSFPHTGGSMVPRATGESPVVAATVRIVGTRESDQMYTTHGRQIQFPKTSPRDSVPGQASPL